MTPLAAASERLRFIGPPDDGAAEGEDHERPKLRLCIERCLTLLRLFVEEVELTLAVTLSLSLSLSLTLTLTLTLTLRLTLTLTLALTLTLVGDHVHTP